MAGGGLEARGPIVGINVTPLVDITLVLLVVFIVTAKIVVTPAVPLDLPQASTATGVQLVFSVVVPPTGALLVNGASVADTPALLEQARAQLAEHPELRAVISADAATPHARVLQVLDTLKRAGLERVAFAAEPLP